MTDAAERSESGPPESGPLARRIHLVIVGVMELMMAAELVALAFDQRWMGMFLVIALMIVIGVPAVAPEKLPVFIPAEIQIFVVLFVFATLFLGEVRDYYERFWWWDLVLHTSSGVLLGLLGFLFVYMVNENRLVDVTMRPSFVALFAFFFGVGIGALWEILEFSADQIFGLTMQKPMLGDPSGLTDTMWDLIVDTMGSATVAVMGWGYMHRARRERTDFWLRRFIRRYPHLFGS
ncbi:hypothetical protein [Croceicoccus mobilis]|uniref:DUF2238 domain-containing protein n=1 Tax=Croceicoccus mobilis TaxID=1703339 RepID=A0A917DSZ0_9SPHN|nr:hypothetical protein [Croceicoccus mobilis]GGD63768.1 hypothetical protein GCM10010990_11570 [Croceicoccus mobilis]